MGVFDNTFKISTAALYLNLGHPSLPLTLKWLVKLTICYIFYLPTFVMIVYSSIFYDNYVKICINISMAILFFIISINYVILVVYKECFNDLIKMTEEDLEQSRTLFSENELIVKDYTAKGLWASKFWLFMIIVGDSMFYCKAILGTPYSALVGNFTLVPMHELSYPKYIEERKNEFYMYVVITGFQAFYIFFTCLMYIGFNPLGPIFIMHACGQIKLVIKQTERLFSKRHVDLEEAITKIREVVRRIQRIYSFVDKIQQTHRILFEMCLKMSAIILPVVCFGVIDSYKNGSISFDLIGYVFSCSMQCFIPSYYCELLLRQGAELRVAIYGCGWERHWAPRSRSIILLMLTRTMRPLAIRAIFSTVGLEAFTHVNYQAYSIFNVMNAVYKS